MIHHETRDPTPAPGQEQPCVCTTQTVAPTVFASTPFLLCIGDIHDRLFASFSNRFMGPGDQEEVKAKTQELIDTRHPWLKECFSFEWEMPDTSRVMRVAWVPRGPTAYYLLLRINARQKEVYKLLDHAYFENEHPEVATEELIATAVDMTYCVQQLETTPPEALVPYIQAWRDTLPSRINARKKNGSY